ncbi:MAG: PepSY-associated TM helix domain-containing protein, partial [Acetobacterium sp.]|nr:PepSY-associated TM helix domain-containing protein [Acetobacterium sp.]
IVGLAGIALLISTITGWLLYGRFMKKQLLASIRTKNLRTIMADWHKFVGIATLAFNLMIAITGAWLGLQPKLMQWFGWKQPNQTEFKIKEKPLSAEEDIECQFSIDSVLSVANNHFSDLQIQSISISTNGDRTVQLRGNVPFTAYENGINKIIIDKASYLPLYKYDVRDKPASHKLYYIQEALHFGDFGGIWLKILYGFFGFTSGALAITGFIIYLKRKASEKTKKTDAQIKKMVWNYSYVCMGIIIFIAILSTQVGITIPSILVSVVFYGWLIWLLIKAFWIFIKRMIDVKLLKTAKQ